ncbi:hypothetical protein FACS1894172_03350 [Spirochaetia bacterium]|nr:hypothetical protein FACS1894172_03350 [Spirochaetia bacterium]
MNVHPFSVFKRAGRPCYSVRFKDEHTGKYLPAISTKKTTEAEAIKTAYEWLRDGIPSKKGVINVNIKEVINKTELSKADAEYIYTVLKKKSLLSGFVIAETKQAIMFEDYLKDFWDYDKSEYIKEKLRKKHSIHKRYTRGQSADVQKYWIPFFAGKFIGEITWDDVDSFIEHLDELPLAAKRKNKIITAGSVPLKYAHHRRLIETDVSAGHTKYSGESAERQILTPELAQAIFRVQWNDERSRLANMLSMVTGMRAGEIQGLQVQDLGKDCVYVRHSWNFADGLKTTKNNEARTVEVPFPGLISDLLNLSASNPHGCNMDGYVFWAELSHDKPMEAEIFLRDLRSALVKTGMSKESAKVYTFHGWRHYYTSYMIERVNEKLLQKQTGHKTLDMLKHYGDHLLTGDRKLIRDAQIEIFAGLLPDGDTALVVG